MYQIQGVILEYNQLFSCLIYKEKYRGNLGKLLTGSWKLKGLDSEGCTNITSGGSRPLAKGGGGIFVYVCSPASFSSLCIYFLAQVRGAGPLCPSPRSITDNPGQYLEVLDWCRGFFYIRCGVKS